MSRFKISEELLPRGFNYPIEFSTLLDLNIVNFEPWIILYDNLLDDKRSGITDRYPSFNLLPFARRLDNDDVACWDLTKQHDIIIIHDYASSDYLIKKTYDDFWGWFRDAIEDMIEHNS